MVTRLLVTTNRLIFLIEWALDNELRHGSLPTGWPRPAFQTQAMPREARCQGPTCQAVNRSCLNAWTNVSCGVA